MRANGPPSGREMEDSEDSEDEGGLRREATVAGSSLEPQTEKTVSVAKEILLSAKVVAESYPSYSGRGERALLKVCTAIAEAAGFQFVLCAPFRKLHASNACIRLYPASKVRCRNAWVYKGRTVYLVQCISPATFLPGSFRVASAQKVGNCGRPTTVSNRGNRIMPPMHTDQLRQCGQCDTLGVAT
eukprot:GHVU01150190.1.p1 GENE.GHVU01150190.1~~GHVU01150190.1.p1  ORF type:complete len:186 (+),score=4.49 GHVU01150190.1:104-661(+)